MLYVPSLNVSPRICNLNSGNYSQGKSRKNKVDNLVNISKSVQIGNEEFADALAFAKLATLPTGQNPNMNIQLFKLQKDNCTSRQRSQQVTEVKVNDDNLEVVKNDLQDMNPLTVKVQETSSEQLKIEMAQKDLELRRALDAEKEYGRKIIGLQTELRYKNNAIIGLKKEFTQMVLSLESNLQKLKSAPIRDESRKAVTLAVKKGTAGIAHNYSSLTKNMGPRVLPVHKTETAKQKTSLPAVEMKATVIDSINKKFVSFETERKGLEDRIRNLEQLLLQQRSVDAAVDSNHIQQTPKPPEASTQPSPAGKNGRTISFVHRSGEHNQHVSAHESLSPIQQSQAIFQPVSIGRELTKNSSEAPSRSIGSEVHIPLTKVSVPPASSPMEPENASTNSASPSDERKVSHPPSARPAMSSPITASRKVRLLTPKRESASSPSVTVEVISAVDVVSNVPPSYHGNTANQPTDIVGMAKDHEPLEKLSDVASTHDGPMEVDGIDSSAEVKASAIQPSSTEQEPNMLSPPLRKEINSEMVKTEEASTIGGLDSAEAAKRQKAALLKEKRKLKRIIHGRKDFFAKSGREPTSEEQQLIDDELRRYTQLVKALKQFEDDNVE